MAAAGGAAPSGPAGAAARVVGSSSGPHALWGWPVQRLTSFPVEKFVGFFHILVEFSVFRSVPVVPPVGGL